MIEDDRRMARGRAIGDEELAMHSHAVARGEDHLPRLDESGRGARWYSARSEIRDPSRRHTCRARGPQRIRVQHCERTIGERDRAPLDSVAGREQDASAARDRHRPHMPSVGIVLVRYDEHAAPIEADPRLLHFGRAAAGHQGAGIASSCGNGIKVRPTTCLPRKHYRVIRSTHES